MSDPREAISYLCFAIGWGGGSIPVYIHGSPRRHAYVHQRAGERLANLAREYDLVENAQVEIGLAEGNDHGPAWSSCLWAWLESRDSAQRAKRFRPMPAVVLRIGSGCRRLALWPLNELVPYVAAEDANKRLAYALHAPQKYARLETLRIPLPGTFVRVGRKRPAPVIATRLELDTFAREEVVGRLKNPPMPWVQRQRESGNWR